ncbi:hypothetical protein RIF29_47157 [Crotalaria pallida]|uniref:Uncharacterized protein n=1 Tax=Crotalaria pallida TaxID=3830 RepID=A0AAN9HJ85_CROPI
MMGLPSSDKSDREPTAQRAEPRVDQAVWRSREAGQRWQRTISHFSQEDIANHFSILSLPEIGECSKVQEERAWRKQHSLMFKNLLPARPSQIFESDQGYRYATAAPSICYIALAFSTLSHRERAKQHHW